jgi:hypothetical protein
MSYVRVLLANYSSFDDDLGSKTFHQGATVNRKPSCKVKGGCQPSSRRILLLSTAANPVNAQPVPICQVLALLFSARQVGGVTNVPDAPLQHPAGRPPEYEQLL